MKPFFIYDERLEIPVPELDRPWPEIALAVRESILLEWEQIRGMIPERIKRLEGIIIRKQEQLNEEEDFAAACRLNSEIAEMASRINDLHLWFRVNQDLGETAEAAKHH